MSERRDVYRVWWVKLRERDYLGDPGLDGSSGSGMWGVDWIELARDMDKWRALVSAVMNRQVT
jgi:hypothetical protein